MYLKTLLIVLLACAAERVIAQEIQTEPGNHKEHESHHHAHHKNEIGIANTLVYSFREALFGYGLHLHYIRNIGHSKFGLGAGFERVFDAHGHNTVGVVACYRPIEKLSLILSPGISFEDAEPGEPGFALHLETVYEFEIGDFHIGPALEFAYDPDDYHIGVGIHIGYGF